MLPATALGSHVLIACLYNLLSHALRLRECWLCGQEWSSG